MADKTLQTRISLKIDTWANWTTVGKDVVLKRGEVAFVQIGDKVPPMPEQAAAGVDGLLTNPNSVLFKVGDGITTFSALKWGSALAADVYDWAKVDQATFESNVKTLIGEALGNGDFNLSGYVTESDFNTFKTQVTSDIATAKSGAEATAKSYTDGEVTTLKNGVIKDAQDTADEAVAAAGAAQSAADAAQAAADEAAQAVTDEATARATAITEAKTEVKGYTDTAVNNAKTELNGTINSVSQQAQTNKSDIAALTTTVGENATTAAAATKKVADDLAAEVTAREEAEEALQGNITTAQNKANDAFEKATQNASDIAALTTSVGTQIATAKSEANAYTDGKIDAIMGEGASETLDTIGEIAKAIEDHRDVTDALNAAIGNKADKTTVDALTATVNTNNETVTAALATKAAQTDLDAANANISKNTGDITALAGRVTTNEGNIGTLNTKVAAIEADYLREADTFYIDCGSATVNV